MNKLVIALRNFKNEKLKRLRARDKYLIVSIVIFLGVALLIIVLVSGISSPNNQNEEYVDPNVIRYSTDTPDEEIPDENYNWLGRPSEPKKIILPSIGINGFVNNVGVDQDQLIAVPNNIHTAGWFVDTVRPGEKGLSIINGHVDGLTTGGIFRKLPELKIGDLYSIENGDGTTNTFSVKEIVTVKTEDAAAILFSQKKGVTHQLNLITCAGIYLEDQSTYSERTIVISELVP